MRILFEALGFGRNDNLGGSVRVAAKNAVTLAARGHDVTFYCTNRSDKSKKLYYSTVEKRIDGVKVIYFKTYTIPFLSGSFGLSYAADVHQRLKNEKPFDVVHLNEYRSYLAMTLARYSLKNDIPFVLQPQGTLIMGNNSKLIKRVYDKLVGNNILTKASKIIAATPVEKQISIERSVSADNISVIPSGINLDEYEHLPTMGLFREKFNISPERMLVLFVGRLDPIKGIDLLVKGFSTIKDPNVHLIIVGPDHGHQKVIEKMVLELGLSNRVLLTGVLPEHADVLSAMMDSDILVVPSRSEAFGMVILEGAILKKPMVITNTCHISGEFENGAAVVVPPEANAIGLAIQKLLNEPELSRQIGRNANHLVKKRFRISEVVNNIENLYKEVKITL